MEGNITFEVQVMSTKSAWKSVGRHQNPTDARTEARKLSATRKYLGVKVIQEHFDYVDNRFVEKTIFKQMKQDDRGGFYEATLEKAKIGRAHV